MRTTCRKFMQTQDNNLCSLQRPVNVVNFQHVQMKIHQVLTLSGVIVGHRQLYK